MSEWEEKSLSDLAILYKDSWNVGDEECPYIALEHIEEGKLRLNGVGHSDIVTSNKYRFNEKNFLFGKLRPYFRKVVRPRFSGICSTDIWVVGANGETDLTFLFYLFANQEFVNLAYSGSSGTRMPRADWKFMKDTAWFIPSDIEEQRAIASVLSSLDDKIDLLHRQNQTLEAMAETLFRQWFVEEADEGWGEMSITELFEIRDGTHDSPKQKEIGKPLITSKHILKNRLDIENAYLISEDDFENVNRRSKVDTNDILFSMIGTIGLIYLETSSEINYAIKNIGLFKTSQNPYWAYYTFLWLKSSLEQDFIHEHRSGSTQEYISLGSLRSIVFNYPPIELLSEFNESVNSYFNKININNYQIRTIEKMRDMLLPKLISGQIRIWSEPHFVYNQLRNFTT